MTVFISYHHSKLDVAEHIAAYFQRRGIATWYAPRDVHPGRDWDTAISDAIRSSSALVLLFCSDADASRHVKRELSLADSARVPVYWLRLERVEPDKLGYFLSATQWIDWIDDRDQTLESLVDDLRAVEDGARARGDLTAAPAEPARAAESPDTQLGGSWPRGILAFPTERLAAEAAARVYLHVAQKYPDSSVVLPTGRAATQVFRAMLRVAADVGDRPFGDAHLISDTETFGVWEGHHTSRTRHVREALIEPLEARGLAPDADRIHLLSGVFMGDDPVQAAAQVVRRWPPSVHGVSMSPSGEVLGYEVGTYNEPEEYVEDGPRVVEVTDHGKRYIDPDQPSRSILTIGMGTALGAEVLLLLAFDAQKAPILRRMVMGPETSGVPATMLRRHLNAYALVTTGLAEAAGLGAVVTAEMSPQEAAEMIVAQT